MKELSIEEKAKRYDETLEKATALYRASEPMSGCNVIIETLFPELKESESERIRKELLEHCKNQAEPYIQSGNKCSQIQSWIAWLEKQGEQKPAWGEEDENRFNNLCWLIDKSDENEPTKTGFKNWLKDRALPQPKQEWSEEDEKHRLNCLSYFNMIEKTSPYYEDYLWLKSLRNNNK